MQEMHRQESPTAFPRNLLLMTIDPKTKPIVLVLDPDPLTMTGMAAALHTAGYEVHCARDGQAARKAAHALVFDLVVSEVKVEGESGLDICREIQASEKNRDVSVMFVTSYQSPDIIRRSHAAGGVYYLRKPFDPNVLLELVDKALWMPHLVRSRIDREQGLTPAATSTTPATEHRLTPQDLFTGESFTQGLPTSMKPHVAPAKETAAEAAEDHIRTSESAEDQSRRSIRRPHAPRKAEVRRASRHGR